MGQLRPFRPLGSARPPGGARRGLCLRHLPVGLRRAGRAAVHVGRAEPLLGGGPALLAKGHQVRPMGKQTLGRAEPDRAIWGLLASHLRPIIQPLTSNLQPPARQLTSCFKRRPCRRTGSQASLQAAGWQGAGSASAGDGCAGSKSPVAAAPGVVSSGSKPTPPGISPSPPRSEMLLYEPLMEHRLHQVLFSHTLGVRSHSAFSVTRGLP